MISRKRRDKLGHDQFQGETLAELEDLLGHGFDPTAQARQVKQNLASLLG